MYIKCLCKSYLPACNVGSYLQLKIVCRSAKIAAVKTSIMKRILYFALLIIICTEQCESNETIAIIRQILQHTMRNSYCVVYSWLSTNIPSIIPKAITLTDSHTFYTTNQQIKTLKCKGYILHSEDFADLRSAFAKQILESDQLLNRKIVVFYSGTVSEKNDLIELYPKGTRVIFVKGVDKGDINIWNKTTTKTAQHLKMTFALTGKVIVQKTFEHFDPRDLEKFQPKYWRPQIGRRLRISLFRYRPSVVYNNKSKTFSGTEYNIIREITKNWPVEHKFHGQYDENSLNGVRFWEEITKDVSRGDSDIALCSLWQSANLRKKRIPDISTHPSLCHFFSPKTEPFARSCVRFPTTAFDFMDFNSRCSDIDVLCRQISYICRGKEPNQ